jgi:hypothetical protein
MVTNVKLKTSSTLFSPEAIQAMVDAAPATVPFDPDCPPTRPEDWDNAVFVPGGGYPAVKAALAAHRRTRGPNQLPAKEQIAIRLSPDVLAAFRADGPGWQTRIDNALRDWIKTRAGSNDHGQPTN